MTSEWIVTTNADGQLECIGELIRCKDCKKSHSTACPIDDGLSVSENFYCAWAERKEE